MPSAELMSGADPATIVDYLHNSHSFYMQKEFAGLEEELKAMVEPCDATQKRLWPDSSQTIRLR